MDLIFGRSTDKKRQNALLKKLVVLKGLVLAISALIILSVIYYFDIDLPVFSVLGAFGANTFLLLGWAARLNWRFPLTDIEALCLLFSDVIFIGYLIFIGGGSSNPFTSSILVPIALAAALLPKRFSMSLLVLAIAVYTYWVITDSHIHHRGMHLGAFELHLVGMWFNFVASAVLLYIFIYYAAESVRKGERKLAEAREKILKNEQLIAVANLTASTAHSLGTPISTLAILSETMGQQGQLSTEQINLLQSQIGVCKTHLQNLTRLADAAEPLTNEVKSVSDFRDQLKEYFSLVFPNAHIDFSVSGADDHQIRFGQSLKLAIANLIENACDAAQHSVKVNFCVQEKLVIEITDDGEGITLDSVENIGRPFISSKQGGLGLGVYLSNSTIESFGGSIVMSNLPKSGAQIVVELPLINYG